MNILFEVMDPELLEELIENGLFSEETRLLGEFVKEMCKRGYRHPELRAVIDIYESLPIRGQLH